MLRSYKYRIYPTDEQKEMLAKTFGCCRYVYNWALDMKEKVYKETGANISEYEMKKRVVHNLKHDSAPWLSEVSSKALELAINDLYRGYKYFFEGRANKPKYRCKNHRQHYHDSGNAHGNGMHVSFAKGYITIPKIKEIPCVFHRRFSGRMKQVCIELLPSGQYFASILVDDGKAFPEKALIEESKTIGIDTGLSRFATLSDGQIYEPSKQLKKEARKIKLLSRRLEKKEKGSKQFKVIKHRLAKIHQQVANRRRDYIQKITHYLAYENQATTICVENLNLLGMRRNKHLSGSFNDAAIGEFYRQLEYKCRWSGKNFIKINRFAPSSKRCCQCGHVYKDLSLAEREWNCPVCHTHHDRDLNAAINIKHIGLSEQQTLPSVRREVTPVEQPLVDDRSLEPKKLHRCYIARRERANEAGKMKGNGIQHGVSDASMPQSQKVTLAD